MRGWIGIKISKTYKMKNQITIEVIIEATIDEVWNLWTSPVHIKKWNNINEDRYTPKVEIALKDGGMFLYRMKKKDGSFGFDHSGKYDNVIIGELIEYTLTDGRKAINRFRQENKHVRLTETFDPELETPIEEQCNFCKFILNNFKKYAEHKNKQAGNNMRV
jgi:uncharacterized protein YndB with AHSA1/START domain